MSMTPLSDLVTVPITERFNPRKPPLGSLTIRKSALPSDPNFVFSIAYIESVDPKVSHYQLVSASLYSDQDYQQYLVRVRRERGRCPFCGSVIRDGACTVCRITEAALTNACHHCNEHPPSRLCHWCGRRGTLPDSATIEEQIARLAHRGQLDKAGNPYILHVERVVARVKGNAAAAAVAWLHDVLEDSPFTADQLVQFGVSVETIQFVQALTRVRPFDYQDHIYQVLKVGGVAVDVKIADIDDHLENPGCPPTLRPRYETAQRILKAAAGGLR